MHFSMLVKVLIKKGRGKGRKKGGKGGKGKREKKKRRRKEERITIDGLASNTFAINASRNV